jgi:hypothetical protein
MDGLGNALGQMFGCLIAIIVVLAIGVIGTMCYYFFNDDSIKSDKPIKPQIELVIKNNKVDTLYVYRKPIR